MGYTLTMRLLLAMVLLLSLAAHAADCTGKEVAVVDGDSITVLREHEQIKMRLNEIDAPEKAQAFGNRSKQSLSEAGFDKTATLADQG